MNVRVFTFVYGRYLEWFKRSVTSLSWPQNKRALEGCVWSVHTSEDDERQVREILEPFGLRVEVTRITPNQDNVGRQLSERLVVELKDCLKKRSGMLLAPPDTIFGDGTIQTLISLGFESRNCTISVAHPRVYSETFPDLKEPTSNAKLVGLAFEHMHEVWKLSDIRLPSNNMWTSGTGWRVIGPKLWAVSMRIPTPYFCRPDQSDVDHLENSGPGAWDHKWPRHLVTYHKHRMVGSSDAAFMVELSPKTIPQGELRSSNKDDMDAYRGDLAHHHANRNNIVIWRAE